MGVARASERDRAGDGNVRRFALGGVCLIAPSGELDLYAAPALKQEILAAVTPGVQKLVVDLLEVTFIDSTALGVLVDAAKRVRSRGGSVALVCRDPNVVRVLEITGLATLFAVHTSIPAAISGPERRP